MKYVWIVEAPGDVKLAVKTRAQAQELVLLYYTEENAFNPVLFDLLAKKVLFYPEGDDDE